jgi:chromosomal replication initiation ATPase DnaA
MVIELDKTCEVISSLANVNKEDILSDKRAWPLPACRDVLFMHYRKLGFSGNSIGRMFNRDHSTVFSGINRLQSWIDAHDKFVTQLYESFNDECG